MPCVTTVNVYPARFSENYNDLDPIDQEKVRLLLEEAIRKVVPTHLSDQWKTCVFTGPVTRGFVFACIDETIVAKLPPPTSVARLWALATTDPNDWVPISPTEHETTKLLQQVRRGDRNRVDYWFTVMYENEKYTSAAEFMYSYQRVPVIG